jgi:hypothetical protein
MHMPIGTKHCCGVIEIFPEGEFKQIRGYGNMARRMGHHYKDMFLSGADSGSDGATVSPSLLKEKVVELISAIKNSPTCVLPTVISDPYFDNEKTEKY